MTAFLSAAGVLADASDGLWGSSLGLVPMIATRLLGTRLGARWLVLSLLAVMGPRR